MAGRQSDIPLFMQTLNVTLIYTISGPVIFPEGNPLSKCFGRFAEKRQHDLKENFFVPNSSPSNRKKIPFSDKFILPNVWFPSWETNLYGESLGKALNSSS